MSGLLREVWERLQLYFPLISMGILALATYWLVRSTPPALGPVAPRVVAHEADYFMRDFSVKTFDVTGRVKTEVAGAVARHYPDTKWLEVDRVRVRSFDELGRVTTATANQGLTNEDSSEVQLLGNALVVREAFQGDGKGASWPRLEYRGVFLHAFLREERVVSDQPVELIRGNDRFTADHVVFDGVDQVLELRGRVRGVLAPGGK